MFCFIFSAWSADGCYVESTNRSHTVCMCNHLTNFAILMDIVDDTSSTLLSPLDDTVRILIYLSIAICILLILIALLTLKFFNGIFVKVRSSEIRSSQAESYPHFFNTNGSIHNNLNSSSNNVHCANVDITSNLESRTPPLCAADLVLDGSSSNTFGLETGLEKRDGSDCRYISSNLGAYPISANNNNMQQMHCHQHHHHHHHLHLESSIQLKFLNKQSNTYTLNNMRNEHHDLSDTHLRDFPV